VLSPFKAFSLKTWIDDNRHLLKPPVGNKVIFKDREFIVMAVGGPNARTDFHVNQSEEFFYQVEGQMTLKVITPEHRLEDIVMKAGDIYLLPPNTPHSPQRSAGGVGLVIERTRRPGEIDGLQWYCEKCLNKLYEEFFVLTDIETQFPAVFERYYGSDAVNCKACGHKNGRVWQNA
jgi:3-hydroxyanthranilate 3,4-dioxygenase